MIVINRFVMSWLTRAYVVSFFWFFTSFMSVTGYAETLLPVLGGQDIPLSSLKGKWVFINYWASWCRPCLNEIQTLNRFYKKNSQRIALFAVNYDALPQKEQEQLIAKFNIHYPSLSYLNLSALNVCDVTVVPVTFVLNPQGVLSTTLLGEQTIESLTNVIMSPHSPSSV